MVDAFAIAPVENPDGKRGVNLHVDLGPTSVLNYVTGATTTWGALSRASEVRFQTILGSFSGRDYDWSEVDAFKAMHFARAKRRTVFHYALFANNYSPRSSGGISRGLNAADFIVTKAGPGTIAEALNAHLPIILYSKLPGQDDSR